VTAEADVSTEQIRRAMTPQIEFGRRLLVEASSHWGSYVVLTMPEPWEVARGMVSQTPKHVHFLESMDRAVTETAERLLPPADTIVGIGGGMALDMAKYVAWQRDTEPVLVPSIASVDACVTNTIAVRDAGKVRYIGFVVPRVVLADFDLMQSAPAHLNRAGIGDILSIHTALWDWKAAAERGCGAFDPVVAEQVAALVNELEAHCGGIRNTTEESLRWLIEAYAAENALCLGVGHSRPEEGSEHFFAYNVEHRTGRGFVHGELVCLGVLLLSRLQENHPERVQSILTSSAVRYQPRDLGLSRSEIEQALATLLEYVEAERLPYSVINERPPDTAQIEATCSDLRF